MLRLLGGLDVGTADANCGPMAKRLWVAGRSERRWSSTHSRAARQSSPSAAAGCLSAVATARKKGSEETAECQTCSTTFLAQPIWRTGDILMQQIEALEARADEYRRYLETVEVSIKELKTDIGLLEPVKEKTKKKNPLDRQKRETG